MYRPKEEIVIRRDATLIDTLELMDSRDRKLFLVLDNHDNYIGLVSAGDIQRAILKNTNLKTPIEKILRKEVKTANITDSVDCIYEQMKQFRMEFIPILDKDNVLRNVIYWREVFKNEDRKIYKKFDLPVVLMAGGLGSRLRPLTFVLPKPLIPVGEKTIAEEIFFRFSKFGVSNFLLSLNYKADFIKQYLSQQNLPYKIESFTESTPLGTIGSLTLMKNSLKTTFFVTNCDILIDEDYSDILKFHNDSKNEITVVSALKTVKIPYGVIETENEGQISRLIEKPSLGFNVNTGMYIIEPHVIKSIPKNTFYNITDLIQKILDQGGKVGAFPISEGSWIDTGIWSEYISNYVKE